MTFKSLLLALMLALLVSPCFADDDDGGGEVEFKGVIESLPGGGLNGNWEIGGRTVVVGSFTELREKEGPFEVGACAEVEGSELPDGRVEAEKIETEDADECGQPDEDDDDGEDNDEVEFTGVIDSLPADGLLGEWEIGGEIVVVDASTELRTEDGPFVEGACAEVEGVRQEDGKVLAEKVKTEDGEECGLPDGEDDEVEFKGIIESLPADGVLGEWEIGGEIVVVDASTELETEDGPFVEGACAEVEGVRQEDGKVLAEKVETEDPDECGGAVPNPDDPGAPPAGPGGFPNEIKFHGFIDSFPDGLIGTWVISGRDVEAGAGTDFEPEDGPFEVGACAEVKGTLFPDGTIDTREIETEPDDECEPDDILPRVDLTGVIESLPGAKAAEELVGNWVVGGITVEVLPGTEIEQDKGPIAVGACVEVDDGELQDDNTIIAVDEIEVESSSAGCVRRNDEPDEVEFFGVIQTLPDTPDLLGEWMIAGRTVVVDSFTIIDLDGMTAEEGLCVEVKGIVLMDGSILATKIEKDDSESPCGAGAPGPAPVEFRGLIVTLPDTPDLIGTWDIGGRAVLVTGATELKPNEGPFAEGACAEVEGTLLDDGSIDAREVETENASDCDGGSSDDGFFAFVGLVESPPGAAALAAKSGNGSTAGDLVSRAKGAALGVWRIGQRAVTVEAGTVFDEAGGSLNLGACVEVDGQLLPGGGFTATRVDVLSSSGTCLVPDGIVNAATFQEQSLSPGQIVSVFGLAVGPLDDAALQIRGGRVVSRLGGTRVLFDGVPGAVIFASANQVNVVAPYSLAGKTSTQIQVERAGGWSNTLTVDVAPSGPGIFTLTQTGVGQAAALNFGLDGLLTLNGPGNRARRGGIVVIFATGEGLLAPPPEDGEIVGDELPRVQLPVSLTIGGVQAVVTYAGGAPGFVAGFVQINAVVPAGIAAGAAVPVVLSVGGVASPAGATIAVQ